MTHRSFLRVQLWTIISHYCPDAIAANIHRSGEGDNFTEICSGVALSSVTKCNV
ncbi:hypothetical protein [Coleofasciculus sp. FACHB-501]|uniref:hypothetical protein n=1 Tax=Coleofasciculus sp. FACHB-501 TaxID=2692786 RepID=UPI0019A409F9|nr:hypothetical protein [Coleofasciculus sp. FACHB-501]MBD1837047.1 hypothetical protein [Coleofasciculus sp. FACHB-501]